MKCAEREGAEEGLLCVVLGGIRGIDDETEAAICQFLGKLFIVNHSLI